MSDPKERAGRDDERDPEKPAAEEPETPPRYLFRILPADPKNDLEFEDMADK